MDNDDKREFLRHTVATLAYRAEKPLRAAPKGFISTRAGETTRSAGEILSHICDLIAWAAHMSSGKPLWHDSKVVSWTKGVKRFDAAMSKLDRVLASNKKLANPAEKIFQGPIADALTHVGQLATLRRLAGAPVKGENYFVAEISIGRIGSDQSTVRREFA
jgi:hypothetical protein